LETGYGYIEASTTKQGDGFTIKRFVEKPDLNTAKNYLQAGNFFWNSGMFAFKASVMLDEFRKFKPEMVKQLQAIVAGNEILDFDKYSLLENISIDFAIMEHTEKGVVLPSDFGWNDIGSWKSLYDFMPKDSDGNVLVSSDVILQKTRNCFVMGRERLIAVNNLENVVIVETPDAVFVSDMETSRDVKNIVNTLKERGRKEYQVHTKVNRPWGYYKILENTDRIKVNEIVVYENSKISEALISEGVKQLMVVGGAAKITLNGETHVLEGSQTLVIPANCPYTLESTADVELHLIEVEKTIPITNKSEIKQTLK
jgi:mannose-1-phosphate guanylyltransferase/mannose-6-phosphate isomerase